MDYTKKTTKPQEEVVRAVEAAAAKRSFRTLHTHHVDRTLAEKGFTIAPYSIVEVCNASFAYQVLTRHPPAGMMLPCRIVVYADGAATTVMLMKPSMIASLMPGEDFGAIPGEVERILMEVVDEAVA
jgi:uncharacterized protein (DUF302 family)